jgi:hypothetical protein
VVVGATPGGELGGTWASPTIDAAHSGSTHAATQAAAEATASGALTTHAAAADPHTGYRLESADHTHASSGLQGGQIAHSATSGRTANDHHNQAHVLTGADHTYSGLTTGHVLTATSATAAAFQAAAGGGATNLPLRSGVYYPAFGLGPLTQTTLVTGFMYGTPFYVPTPCTLAEIAITTAGGVAGTNARIGIYADSAGVPGALVKDYGAVNVSGVGAVSAFSSTVLAVGWYWFAAASQGGGMRVTCAGPSSPYGTLSTMIPTTGPTSIAMLYSLVKTGVTGALPTPWGTERIPFEYAVQAWLAFSAV